MAITPLKFTRWKIEYGDDVELITKLNNLMTDFEAFAEELNIEFAGGPVGEQPGGINAPATPLNPIIDTITENSARLRWTRPDETNIAKYLLYRQALPDGIPVLVTVLDPVSSYTFTGLAASTQYRFEVIGQNADGDNGQGVGAAAVTATPQGAPGRASDTYAQTLETPIINRLERDGAGTVRFYHGPSTSNNYPSGTQYEFEVGTQVYGPGPSGYFAIQNAAPGTVGKLRAIHIAQQRRSADASKAITLV